MGTVKVMWLGVVTALLILQKQHIAAEQECDDEGGCKLALPVVDYDFEYDDESPLGSMISSQKSLIVNKSEDTPSQKFIISGDGSHVLAHLNPADFSDEEGEATRSGFARYFGMGSRSGQDTTTKKPAEKKTRTFGSRFKSLFNSDRPQSDKTVSTKDKNKDKKEKNLSKSFMNLFRKPPKEEKKPKTGSSSNSALADLFKKEMQGSKSKNSSANTVKPKKKNNGIFSIFAKKGNTKTNGTLAKATKPKKSKTESKTAQKLISIFKTVKSNKNEGNFRPANNSSEEDWGLEPKKKRKGMKKVKHVAMTVLKKLVATARKLWEDRKGFMEELPFRFKNATIGRLERSIERRLHISIDLMDGMKAFEKTIAGCAEKNKEILRDLWKHIDGEAFKCAGDSLKKAYNIIKDFRQIGLKVRGVKKEVKTKLSNCVLGIGPDGLDIGDNEKVSRDVVMEHMHGNIDFDGKLDKRFDQGPDYTESNSSLGGDSNEETDVSIELSDDDDDDHDDDDDDDDDEDDDNNANVKAHSVIRRDLMQILSETMSCGTKVLSTAVREMTAMPEKIVSLLDAGTTLMSKEGGKIIGCFEAVIQKERKTLDRMAFIMGACTIIGV